jgi:ribosomal-protein-alanine N-acetyltransferase
MKRKDLAAVVAMEKDLFTDPWPRELFERELLGDGIGYSVVGEEGGEVVCYGIAWRVKGEFHVANMAVRRDRQRSGLGAALIDRMLVDAREEGFRIATLEVRISNRRAIRLYRSRSFREIALRRGYYPDNNEDALVMLCDLVSGAGDEGGLVSES